MKNLGLPQESADALSRSLKSIVQDATGLEIGVLYEDPATFDGNLPVFVVTIPDAAAPEQRTEAGYWINAVAFLFRYSDQPGLTHNREH
jgi:hypothetical protein